MQMVMSRVSCHILIQTSSHLTAFILAPALVASVVTPSKSGTKDKRRGKFTFKSKKQENTPVAARVGLISKPSDFQHVSHVGQEQMGRQASGSKVGLPDTLKTAPPSPRVPEDYYRVGAQTTRMG